MIKVINMSKYVFEGLKYDKATIDKRLIATKPDFKRFMTGFSGLDEVIGGFPNGLTVLWGTSGTGKSLMCKAVADRVADFGKLPLYICAESLADAPDMDKCLTMDFTRFLPNWRKAISQVLGCIVEYEPDIVFIDSLTTLLSGTTKAVSEADIRQGCFEISKCADGVIPIISSSEIRGQGNFAYQAGGAGVAHSCTLLIKFERIKIDKRWLCDRYNASEGERVYLIDVEKDRHGISQQGNEFKINYVNGEISLERVSYRPEENVDIDF